MKKNHKTWSTSCTLYAFMRSRGSTLGPSSESWFWSSVRTVSSMLRSQTPEDRETERCSWMVEDGGLAFSNLLFKGWKHVRVPAFVHLQQMFWWTRELPNFIISSDRTGAHALEMTYTLFYIHTKTSSDNRKQFNAANVEFAGGKKALKHLMNMEEGELLSFLKLEWNSVLVLQIILSAHHHEVSCCVHGPAPFSIPLIMEW